ncbi:MAG: hypothetical protein HQK75_14050 [Candidatus Magnetomorum sp.]|nr:hypothetical protein [Candidatus Magnetomorum sp.]
MSVHKSFVCGMMVQTLFFCLIFNKVSIAKISGTEHLLYTIQINGKSYKETVIVHRTEDLLQYESCGDYTSPKVYAPGGNHCWDVLSTSDGYPRLIEYHVGPNTMQMTFTKDGHFEMEGFWDGKKCSNQKVFENNVYVEISSLIRTMNLKQNTPFIFELIRLPEFPMIKTHQLYVQILNDSIVNVPAGRFSCKKILFSASGYKGYFFKAYFYVSIDERQLIVKIENLPIGGKTELVKMSFEPV